jgi:hypothetical protein
VGDLLQPWHLLVLLLIASPLLIPAIFFLLALQNTLTKCSPAARTMDPGMVWLMLVPLLNLVWGFLVVIAIGKSLRNEFNARGIPCAEPFPAQPIGLAMCVCACCGLIPYLGVLALLGQITLSIIYWVKVTDYSRLLEFSPQTAHAPPIW